MFCQRSSRAPWRVSHVDWRSSTTFCYIAHIDCRSFTVFSSISHLPVKAWTSLLRTSTLSPVPLVSSICHQQSVEQHPVNIPISWEDVSDASSVEEWIVPHEGVFWARFPLVLRISAVTFRLWVFEGLLWTPPEEARRRFFLLPRVLRNILSWDIATESPWAV